LLFGVIFNTKVYRLLLYESSAQVIVQMHYRQLCWTLLVNAVFFKNFFSPGTFDLMRY